MRNVLRSLLALLIGGAAFFAIGYFGRDFLPEALQSWFANSLIFKAALKALAVILVGIPVAYFTASLLGLGGETTRKDIMGATIMRLKAGTRWFCVIFGLGLAGLMILAMGEAENPVALILYGPFLVLFLGLAAWVIKARVQYDHYELVVTDYWLRDRAYRWGDLERVDYVRENLKYHLHFSGGRKVRVSIVFAGLDPFLQTAYAKIGE